MVPREKQNRHAKTIKNLKLIITNIFVQLNRKIKLG